MKTMSAAELSEVLKSLMPEKDYREAVVENIDDGTVHLRFPFHDEYLGPGSVFSGPSLLGFADTAMFAAAQAALAGEGVAMGFGMNMTFLSPAKPTDILAESRVLRRGKNLLFTEAQLYSAGEPEPFMQASGMNKIFAPFV